MANGFFLLLPKLTAVNMQIFLDLVAAAHPERFNLMLMDQSGAPTARRLRIPSNIDQVFFEPAGPDLNPTERRWEDRRSKITGQCSTSPRQFGKRAGEAQRSGVRCKRVPGGTAKPRLRERHHDRKTNLPCSGNTPSLQAVVRQLRGDENDSRFKTPTDAL
ncbi:MAG: hypothetical protein ACP5JH_12145, partial [Bacteroidota bacterium]